jgi:flagellar biosynthetic protein FliQ
MQVFDELLRETMVVTALLALPTLLVSAVAGTAVAIVQSATQIQEQTLTLLPKLLAVAAVVLLLGGAGMHACVRLFDDAVAAIPAFAASP